MTPEQRAWKSGTRLVVPGALGTSVIALIQLLQLKQPLTPLEYPLTISVHCFAVSMPFLAGSLIVQTYLGEVQDKDRRPTALDKGKRARQLFNLIGLTAFYFGIGSIFMYFSLSAGIVFLLALVPAVPYAFLHSPEFEKSIEKRFNDEPMPKWYMPLVILVFSLFPILWIAMAVILLYAFAPSEWLEYYLLLQSMDLLNFVWP
jgi:hypothetical protein